MTQVKVIRSSAALKLEEVINEFIKDKQVVHINFSVLKNGDSLAYVALIRYVA